MKKLEFNINFLFTKIEYKLKFERETIAIQKINPSIDQ